MKNNLTITLVQNRQPAGAHTRYDEWLAEESDAVIARTRFYVIGNKEYRKNSLQALNKLYDKLKILDKTEVYCKK